MSSGPSLYRRHRPRTFADVVGQEHVVRTLRNAVEQGKVHHAYLFVGSRGTGKTSMAKILAACLNCERGPTVEPCGVCDSCRAIASATSLDVIEMDAASNNSVEDIRELRERVAYAPVSGRHKVYILDEAHMLSSQAWNAFLKTLEEPPPDTVFVLATTEAQKVLPTVVDRCHRFDFQRPAVAQVASVLRRAADAEGIEVGDDALALVARSATGSFRDALGTLEQLTIYGGTRIALEDVLAVLGIADDELLREGAAAVGAHDPARALRLVARVAESGGDLMQFYRDLERHLRGLLVVQTLGEVPESLRLTAEHDAALSAQAATIPAADVVRALDGLAAALAAVRDGADARIQLELALLKAAEPRMDASTRALLTRLERLEARIAGGAPAPAPPAPAPAPRTEPREPSASAFPRHAAAVAAAVAVAAPQAEPEPAPTPAPVAAVATDLELDLDGARALWPAVLEVVQGENALLGALLGSARPVACAQDTLTIAFASSQAFLKKKAEDRANRDVIAGAIRTLAGHAPRLEFELRDPEELGAMAVALSPDEWIERFRDEFGAEEIADDHDEEAGA